MAYIWREMMENFVWKCPTRLIFGKDVINTVADRIKAEKGTKVLLVYGGGSIKKNGVYKTVTDSLNAGGIPFVELSGVQPNPRLSLVLEGIDIVRKQKIDFLLAVGGGSVIDTCKAISFGNELKEGEDIWNDYFMKAGCYVPKGIGVGVVLTLPAAGSEMSNSCVITNEKNGHKRGANHENNYPAFAILDPQVCYTLPPYQTACGAADMLSHMMERYFSPSTGIDLTDALLEGAMRTVIQYGPLACKYPTVYEYREQIMLAGTLAHNNLFGCGRVQDWASHWMEHELSAMYDIAHGAGLAIMTPAWMKYVYKANVPRFVQFAVNVMGSSMSIADQEKTALDGIARLEAWFKGIGLPVRLSDANIKGDKIDVMVGKMFEGRTAAGGLKKLYPEDVKKIYEMAL